MFFSTPIFGDFSKFDRDQLFMAKDLIEYAKVTLIIRLSPYNGFQVEYFWTQAIYK
jgi:hypothetical protein